MTAKYIPGIGNSEAKLMVVGEAPGAYEEANGLPFCGPSGKLLDEFLSKAGLSRNDVYLTNVFKYRPPGNDIKKAKETGHTIEEGIPQLISEIKTIAPNAILALGNTALYYLTGKKGINKYRGSILQGNYGVKVIPTIHPANLIERTDRKGLLPYSTRYYIQLDINRAAGESHFNDLRLPKRFHQIARNSLDVQRYFENNNDKLEVAVDIEISQSIPFCIGFAFTPFHAMSIPLIPLTGIGYEGMSVEELSRIWQYVAKALSTKKIIGQNYKFDDQRLRAIGFTSNVYADTMLMSHTLQPELPKTLAFLTSIYTKEPFYKDEGREYDPSKDKLDQMFTYNCKDAAVTFEIYEAMKEELEQAGLTPFFFDYVMRLHPFYRDIEEVGIRVNTTLREELWHKYDKADKELTASLFEILGGEINLNSPLQVHKALLSLGFPVRDSTDEDSLYALLGNHCKNERQSRFLSNLLAVRKTRKTRDTYIGSPLDLDGRIRTSYRITGTETGRSSTTKVGPPTRPNIWVNAKGKSVDSGLSFQTMTKHGDIGADLRSIFIADDDYIFLNVDLSQAEPRIVSILSKDYELLEKFGKIDIHKETAGWFFSLPFDEAQAMSKEDPRRFVGKTGRNGGNYDVGKHRLMQQINTDSKKYGIEMEPISEKKADVILAIFHQKSPKIRGIFHEEVKQALMDNNRILTNPFGRRRQFLNKWGSSVLKEAYATLPQGTVGDKLKNTGLNIKKRIPDITILAILIEAHDAYLFQIKQSHLKECAEIIKEEFEKPIDFTRCSLPRGELIIPCDMETGMDYLNLTKYKT